MFENIGRKIKGVAQFITLLGIIVSIMFFLSLIEDNTVIAFAVLIVGCVGSWLSSLLLYGFGQLIENTDIIAGKQVSKQLPEGDDSYYKNDPYFRPSEPDERTFDQVVDSLDLLDWQKDQLKVLKKHYVDGLIEGADCCRKIKQVASDLPEKMITKLISKL